MLAAATLPTRIILSDRTERFDRRLARREMRYLEWAARQSQRFADERLIGIESYVPYLTSPSSWLAVVEARIRDSVLPDEYDGDISSEWLTEDAAYAAIAFFREGADLLNTEPHIYATNSGDLVAEFEIPAASFTSVISDKETILFGAPKSDPENPIHAVILRGSSSLRAELKAFTSKLLSGRYGKVESAR